MGHNLRPQCFRLFADPYSPSPLVGEGRDRGCLGFSSAARPLTLSLSSGAAILAACRLEACSTGGEGTYSRRAGDMPSYRSYKSIGNSRYWR
jgi:hypothetical protein